MSRDSKRWQNYVREARIREFGMLTVAETVDKLHPICVRCGSPGTRNQRLGDGVPAPYGGPQIQVGGHEVPSGQRYQTFLLDLLGTTPQDAVVLTHESLKRRA
jgi:thymidine kinase